MKENSTLAEMSDKDGRRNLRMYPMSLSNNDSRKYIRWRPVKGPLRSLVKGGAVLFDNVNMHDLHNAYTPDSVLVDLSEVMCRSNSVLYFMSTHQWKKYKMFNAEECVYNNERILTSSHTPPFMRLLGARPEKDSPSNLNNCTWCQLKARLRGMVDGKLV